MKLWLVLLLSGCASIGGDEIELEDVGSGKPALAASLSAGNVEYNANGKRGKFEWMHCAHSDKNVQKTFVVLNYDKTTFTSQSFCGDWLAQSFLSANYHVLGLNVPNLDYFGPDTVTALQSGLASLAKTQPLRKLTGIWAYSTSTMAAGFLAKKLSSVEQLILGGGVYDLEAIQSEEGGLKKELQTVLANEKDSSSFFEKRSLAWDTSSLPKDLFLYHGKADAYISAKQSSSMRDTLASGEFHVRLQLLDEFSHDLKPEQHQSVLLAILKAK